MALAVSFEGVLSCGEPTCSAGSRSFGGGELCAARPHIQFSADGASGGDFPVRVEKKGKFLRLHFRCQSVRTVLIQRGFRSQAHFGAALNEHPYAVPRVRN